MEVVWLIGVVIVSLLAGLSYRYMKKRIEVSITIVEDFSESISIESSEQHLLDTPPKSPGCRHSFADRMKRPAFSVPVENLSPDIPGCVPIDERYFGGRRALDVSRQDQDSIN